MSDLAASMQIFFAISPFVVVVGPLEAFALVSVLTLWIFVTHCVLWNERDASSKNLCGKRLT